MYLNSAKPRWTVVSSSKKLHRSFTLKSQFTCPKNELFLGIFHTTPIIDIHIIIFGLDKSTLKVYERKKLFILHNFYIKNLSIFLAPPQKAWLLCGCFLREESSETRNLKIFSFSMSVATVRSIIINFYSKITKWRLSKFFFRKIKFLSDFSVNKNSKNQNFYIILGSTVAIHVPNMSRIWAEYVPNTRIGPVVLEKISTQHEKSDFEK